MRRVRSGSMLIQQIILMSIASSLLMTVVSLLHFRANEMLSLSLRRLAVQFREDVHATEQIVANNASHLELRRFDQSVVHYLVTPESIQRELTLSAADHMKTTDRFLIPKRSEAIISVDGYSCDLQINGPANPESGKSAQVHLLVRSKCLPPPYRFKNEQEETENE